MIELDNMSPENIRTQFDTSEMNTSMNAVEELNKCAYYNDDPYIPTQDPRAINVVENIKNAIEVIEPVPQNNIVEELLSRVQTYGQVLESVLPTTTTLVPEVIFETPQVFKSGDNSIDLSVNSIKADGNGGAIHVADGASLVINGKGTVHGTLGADDYSMAVWAVGEGTSVIINDGQFTNETDGSERGTDLIYASNGANVVINGGTFQAANPQWTLNCKDKSGAMITVRGGRFYQFDPSNTKVAVEGYPEVVVPEGYEVRQSGDWYVVCQCL